MSFEAELPGLKLTTEALQMICLRYQVISRFTSSRQVLEVGCGGGLGLGYLARNADKVVGGDYSMDNLRCAKEYCTGRAELVWLDAHQMPFQDGSFDVIAAMQVIQYLNIDRFLNECQRVTKADGVLIINLPNKERPFFQPSPLSRNYFSAAELFTALKKHNFEPEVFGAFPVPGRTSWSMWQQARLAAGKILNLLPRGKWLKAHLASATSGTSMVLKGDVGEYIDNGILDGIDLVSINPDQPNHHYQILYAIARPG